MSIEQKGDTRKISRRKFLTMMAYGIAGTAELWWLISSGKERDCLNEQREKTDGYKVYKIHDKRIIELLKSGKIRYIQGGGYEYIGEETFARAREKFDKEEGCQVGEITLIKRKGFVLMYVQAGIVGVNCGEEEYTGEYRSR